ncbi:MAG: 50S ribosomal protein L6 [Actinomycetota bacterium]|nr:50S ribosomal protein L6 [Actinomycetota bacterium]
MSRIGQMPVPLPDEVEISVRGQRVTVGGPKGTLERHFPDPVKVEVEDGVARVTRLDDQRQSRAMHGLSRALLANMVRGVSEGFSRELQMVGVGYRANLKGSNLELLVGYSHPVHVRPPEGITFEVPDPTRIVVRGIDKQVVGQIAADIRSVRPPEPYKGKGIRYVGEVVRRKAGKAGAAR